MSEFNIYFSDDSELEEYEATSRGYRSDVYVKINGSIFNVNVYAMIRLQQDFESEMESYGFYATEPNLVLVKDTNKAEIIETIKKLYKQKYFEGIKSVEYIEINKLIKIY
ncbi:hypothetical protein CLHUN_42810 [Ruminiclostridium hungatei]|uniref:Uncharacterized protein n=1 Tax=Ruminiclostridium hungatei TaxID=48256 RepID=A0A1V4SD53_RUMHU|nr:hypothetical protein [Ruminiclostridium hungatei]OPX41849.1 hypothetical protein CLHUN_42810 [Ruminiclostridium hungatei]